MKAVIPIPIAAPPKVMSISDIAMRTIFKEMKPKHTPFAIGNN